MAASLSPTWEAEAGGPDFTRDRDAVNAALRALCDRYLNPLASPVADAARYTLLGEGKRLRPILLLAAYRAARGTGDAVPLAAAVEVVHAYSLVHDDLPCMDDDDVRRGRPTTHRAHGVRAATAAGVAMVPLAVLSALDAARALGLSPERGGWIVSELMRASGAGGMVGGQWLDLGAEGRELSLPELEAIHRGKTGALIAASVRIGGIAAGAGDVEVRALAAYGEAIGLAFQIADDLLDATATSDQLGKSAGRDAALRKRTYPAILGVRGAAERATALVEQACEELERAGLLTASLAALARFAVSRTR